jgi:hypothetical protein
VKKINIPLTLAMVTIVVFSLYADKKHRQSLTAVDEAITRHGESLVEQGREIFRFDTFGDEEFWGDTLGLHRAIEGERLGGVGSGVSPATALAVGLKLTKTHFHQDCFSK